MENEITSLRDIFIAAFLYFFPPLDIHNLKKKRDNAESLCCSVAIKVAISQGHVQLRAALVFVLLHKQGVLCSNSEAIKPNSSPSCRYKTQPFISATDCHDCELKVSWKIGWKDTGDIVHD